MTRALFVLLMIAGCHAPRHAAGGMPRLIVWTAEVQPDGRTRSSESARFWADWQNKSTGLSAALSRHFNVLYCVVDQHEISAAVNGVRRVPSFQTGGRTVEGYSTPQDLCLRLGMGVFAKDRATSEAGTDDRREPTPITPADARFNEVVEQLRRQAAALAALDQKVRASSNPEDAAQRDGALAALNSKIVDLESVLQSLASRSDAPADAARRAAENPSNSKMARGVFDAVLEYAPALLPVLGIGGPAGIVVGAALWFASRALKARRERRAAAAAPIAQGPPQPPNEPIIARVPDTRHHEAFAWAAEQYLRRYPTGEAAVETIKSLMSQYLKESPRV